MQSNKIFLDSSVTISFIDRANDNHPQAVKLLENLALKGFQLFTSINNTTEAYAYLSRETGSIVALDFLQASLQSDIEILFPQKADLITTFRILKVNKEKQVTLKEALNATLMQRKGISQILTFSYWHNLFGTSVSKLASI